MVELSSSNSVYSIRRAPIVPPIGATLIREGSDSSASVSMTGTVSTRVAKYIDTVAIIATRRRARAPPARMRRRSLQLSRCFELIDSILLDLLLFALNLW